MIVFIAEYPGPDEIASGHALVGSDGRLFQRMLQDARLLKADPVPADFHPELAKLGLRKFVWERSDHLFLNTLAEPLPEKCTPTQRAEIIALRRPIIAEQLSQVDISIIVALGAVALEAFAGTDYKITDARGVLMQCKYIVPGARLMPTLNPGYVRREYRMFKPVVGDLRKAASATELPPDATVACELWVEPSLSDMRTWWQHYGRNAGQLSVDIETFGHNLITCVGFASNDGEHAICVPFVDWRQPGASWWPTVEEENEAWEVIGEWLASPIPKCFHNGCYDVSWLWGVYNRPIRNWVDDTMLMHHVLYPELPKGLEFLGAAYGHPPLPWKTWRVGAEKRGA